MDSQIRNQYHLLSRKPGQEIYLQGTRKNTEDQAVKRRGFGDIGISGRERIGRGLYFKGEYSVIFNLIPTRKCTG